MLRNMKQKLAQNIATHVPTIVLVLLALTLTPHLMSTPPHPSSGSYFSPFLLLPFLLQPLVCAQTGASQQRLIVHKNTKNTISFHQTCFLSVIFWNLYKYDSMEAKGLLVLFNSSQRSLICDNVFSNPMQFVRRTNNLSYKQISQSQVSDWSLFPLVQIKSEKSRT